MSRLDPIPPRKWPPEMRSALAALRPPDADRPRPEGSGGRPKGLNALGVLAHHPRLAAAFNAFNGHILYSSTISSRHRELLILRVAALRNAECEWLQHLVMADEVGISDAEVEHLRAGTVAEQWSPLDRALVAAAEELVTVARIEDETWATLAQSLDERQLMDLVFTVGAYDAVAMAFNTFEVAIDDDLATWHEKRAAR